MRSSRSFMSMRVSSSSAPNGSSISSSRGRWMSARQRDALLHSARELVRPRRQEARQPHQIEQLERVPARGGVVLSEDLHGEQDVVEHVAPRHQARRLEHEAVVAHRPGDLAPADGDRPARLRDQPADDAQQRRLAASARPEQRDELVRRRTRSWRRRAPPPARARSSRAPRPQRPCARFLPCRTPSACPSSA